MKTREIAWRITLPTFILDIWDRYELEQGELRAKVRPLGSLRFELVARVADRPTPITPLRLVMMRKLSGYWIFHGNVVLGNGERRNWRYVQPGTYVLRVSERDEIYAPFEQEVVIRAPKKVDEVLVYKLALAPDRNHPSKFDTKPK
jgi:hypothetical protein